MNPVITDPARPATTPAAATRNRRAGGGQHAGNNPAGQKAGVDADDEELELT